MTLSVGKNENDTKSTFFQEKGQCANWKPYQKFLFIIFRSTFSKFSFNIKTTLTCDGTIP